MPKSYYTFVKIAPNLSSDDTLSIGMIAFDEQNIKVKFSPFRKEIAKKLIGKHDGMIDYIAEQITKNLQDNPQKLQEKVSTKGSNGNDWIASYMEYLQRYSNGTLRFSEPLMINEILTEGGFNALFERMIENIE